MRLPLIACALVVGVVSAAEYGWKSGQQYQYQLRSRTLSGIHQAADQYAGVVLSAQVTATALADDHLHFQISGAKYADLHQELSGGVEGGVPYEQLSWKDLPLQAPAFQLHLQNGVVKKLVATKNIPSWELNLYKGIASQVQIDTQGVNLKKSPMNQMPENEQPFGNYKTMEDSINGVYETLYDISPLPEYVIQSRPELAPLPHLKGNGQLIDIGKTRNFSSSQQHLVYRFGANGYENFVPGSNQMGNFLSRSSVSRVILSGQLDRYTIQSSVTTEKVVAAPHFQRGQKGIVYSNMNLTLQAVKSSQGTPESIQSPREIENLVYEPQNGQDDFWQPRESNESSSEESSSSSSEEMGKIEETISKSAKVKRSIAKNKLEKELVGKNQDDSSSSSSSEGSSMDASDEYLPRKPRLDEAINIELNPGFLGGWGSEQVNYLELINRLSHEVGRWIQKADRLNQQNILDRFALLTQAVASVDSQQLQQASQKLYYQGESAPQFGNEEESEKYQSWVAFRDAVSQAGTGPALLTIQQWINSNQVQGEEAANILAALPNSARYPTNEYMNAFFELIKTPNAQKQRFLNTSAIISFSELARRASPGQSSRTYRRYPVHLFNKENVQERTQAIQEQYIPWFQEQLQQAVAQGDSTRIQLFVRALGNLGHPRILAVFEPYLEGQQKVSDFQRLAMVVALDQLTWTHPKLARNVLYRIYQNTAEAPEIRVAAVLHIMKTNPPAQMLQRMAEFTNYDHSYQVSAAVKSAIETASDSTDASVSWSSELQANARAAANLLTPKDFGIRYSTNLIQSFLSEQQNTEFQGEYSFIQGQDGAYPQAVFANLYRSVAGYDRDPYSISFLSSSSRNLYQLVANFFQGNENSKKMQEGSEHGSQYSYNKIFNMLNVQREEQEQVEGQIYLSIFGANRFFSFDNQTFQQTQRYFNKLQNNLKQGINFQHTRFLNKYSMEVGFPVVMGVPFFYSVQEPAMYSARGQIKGELSKDSQQEGVHIPLKFALNGQAEFTYASQSRGKLGFYAPYNNQQYVAGYNRHNQFYLPLDGKIELHQGQNGFQAELKPFSQKDAKQTLFHRGSQAYTVYQNNKEVQPYQEGQNYSPLKISAQKSYQRDIECNQAGYNLHLEGSGESNFLNIEGLYNAWRKNELLYYLLFHDSNNNINNNEFSASYSPRSGSAQGVKITANYISNQEGHRNPAKMMKKHMPRAAPSGSNLAQPTSYEQRQDELYNNVQQGIQDPEVHMMDLFIGCGENQNENGHSFTIAHASSPVSEQARVLAYYHGLSRDSGNSKPFQAALQYNYQQPRWPVFNFHEALNANPDTNVDGRIDFDNGSGSPAQIQFNGQLKRDEQRKAWLQQQPNSKLCENQMQENNFIQRACRNATVQAGFLNNYNFNIQYQNVPRNVQEAIYNLYSLIRHWAYQHVSEDISRQPKNEGQMNIDVQFENNLQLVNLSIDAPSMRSRFENLKVSRPAAPLVLYHPRYSTLQLYGLQYANAEWKAPAVLDFSQANTFDNTSYPIDLGNCYHVFAIYAPPQDNQESQSQGQSLIDPSQRFAVLVRENGQRQKEVKLVLNEDNIELAPSGSSGQPSVQANGQPLEYSQNQINRWSNGQNRLEIYKQPDGVVVLYAPYNGLQLSYDGSRLKLSLSQRYGDAIRGLAGTFDGEMADEFSLPNNRVIGEPLLFAASYALTEDQSCQGPAKERQKEAQQAQSSEKRVSPGDVVNDIESGKKGTKVDKGSCTQYR
ncbi:vitellogenin-like, partial [Copidosoma floridanum]|uniref:vitellogenin-like n=1 Tax=Copidosoma floridanum TaxID=29053 RepID=UPI0006C96AD7